MPEISDKRPLKVFLCHAHADRDAVRALYTRLTKDGVDAWLDKEKLLPGQDWEYEIRKAVREADVVVVCLSKQFNQAGFRQKEVRLALDTAMEQPEGDIFIIPARLEECDTLESLRKWHWVDLFEDDGYEMLMRALRARANRIGATLQIKKSWLPTGNTQPAFVKKPSLPVEKPVEKKQEKSKSKKEIQKPVTFNKTIIGIASFIVLMVAAIFGLRPLIGKPEPTSIAINTASLKTFTPIPASETPKLAVTSTRIFTITPTHFPKNTSTPFFTKTPDPSDYLDNKGVPMRLVPAGDFIMGKDSNAHKVTLPTYYIDKYEVTNAVYKVCVDLGACEPPVETSSATHSLYYGNPEFDNYPVILVTWNMASTYCTWRGAKLPTEAEWEKAARGVNGQLYPWGNDYDKDCSRANYGNCENDTTPVGSYEKGVSPYNVYDMQGNVWEFINVSDNWGHQIRGGAFVADATYSYVDSTIAVPVFNNMYSSDLGFRCVREVNP